MELKNKVFLFYPECEFCIKKSCPKNKNNDNPVGLFVSTNGWIMNFEPSVDVELMYKKPIILDDYLIKLSMVIDEICIKKDFSDSCGIIRVIAHNISCYYLSLYKYSCLFNYLNNETNIQNEDYDKIYDSLSKFVNLLFFNISEITMREKSYNAISA